MKVRNHPAIHTKYEPIVSAPEAKPKQLIRLDADDPEYSTSAGIQNFAKLSFPDSYISSG